MRVATFNTELARKGPGLLLRDILRGKDPQIDAVIKEIVETRADILALQGFDYDLGNQALSAFAQAIGAQGFDYPYFFAAPPNAGRQTDLDMDGDGKRGDPRDAQGFGRFFGQGSMALLSRYPIAEQDVADFTDLLWQNLPGALLPEQDGGPFPSQEALNIQRLSSKGHWIVPVDHPTFGRVQIMTYHATPPVFDGPEDRNGKRNHDETAFWSLYLEGTFAPAPSGRFVILGDANLDPDNGDGLGEAMATLLAHALVQDPLPHLPTVNWSQTGPMRVDYALPSTDWRITDARVRPVDPDASRHSLVWVDLTQ
ncbi:MAG: endonuclease/exonuclease/phosphatase family protein [Sulfitobacter sp.]